MKGTLVKAYMEREGRHSVLKFALKLLGMDTEFREEDHPRDESGRFTSGGNSAGSAKPASETKPKEVTNDPEGFVEDPDFDIFSFEEEEETPEEIAAKKEHERKAEREEKERGRYGNNGLREEDYPEDLRLTSEEQKIVADIFRAYKDLDFKYDGNKDVMFALNGLETLEHLDYREKELNEAIRQSTEEIEKKKESGYSYKTHNPQSAMTGRQKLAQWWNDIFEHGAPINNWGENGIQYWQRLRAEAKRQSKQLDLARKITKRKEFAEKQPGYMPWSKNPNSTNKRYRPWEENDSIGKLPKREANDGGEGSGNFGHAGRPGEVGGSAPEGEGGTSTGSSSFKSGKEFTGLAESAKKHKDNYSEWMKSMPKEHYTALLEQYNGLETEESFSDYAKRIHNELCKEVKAKNKLDGWEERVSEDDKKFIESEIEKRGSLADVVKNVTSIYDLKRTIDALGKTTDWDKRLLDRDFEGLEEKEEKDLNLLLDQIPWDEDNPKFAHIPNESFADGFNTDVKRYYLTLKAKALGIEGVEIPKEPESLTYFKKNGNAAQNIASKDGGYVKTEAGDQHREAIKESIRNGILSQSPYNTLPEDKVKEYSDAIESTVDNMDDRFAEIVNRTMENVQISWLDSEGTSHYSGNGFMTICTKNGEEFRNPIDVAETFWHEYGHFADDVYGSGSGVEIRRKPLFYSFDTSPGASLICNNGSMYNEAARKDVQALLEMAGLSDEYGVTGRAFSTKVYLYRKSDNQVLDPSSSEDAEDAFKISQSIDKPFKEFLGYGKVLSFMEDHGEPKEVDIHDYIEFYTTPKRHLTRSREKYPGAEEAYREAVIKRSKDMEAWIESIGGQEAYYKLLEEKSALYREYEERQKQMGHITDSIDEAVNGFFGFGALWGGHSMSYYQQDSNPRETAANMFAMRAMNQKAQIEFMERFMPNISRVLTQSWRCGD